MTYCALHNAPRDPQEDCTLCSKEGVRTVEVPLDQVPQLIAERAALGYEYQLTRSFAALVFKVPVNAAVDCFARGCDVPGPHVH